MKTYWDLSERERSELDHDDVEKFVAAELMTKGVLKVRPPATIAVVEPRLRTQTCFVVQSNARYGITDIDVAFRTMEDAKVFLALRPMRVESEYMGHANTTYVRDVDPTAARVTAVELPTSGDVDAMRTAIKEAQATMAANEKEQSRHTQELATQTKALEGLWEDWHTCRATRRELERVIETLDEYMVLAGDERTALRFLQRAFADDKIRDAMEWFNRPAPELESREAKGVALVQEHRKPQDDEVAF